MTSTTTHRSADPAAAAPDQPQVFDLVGIGVGPFGLGLAALSQPLIERGELSACFFDEREGFCWHPGMLLPEATIQVPFMADLVTLADPTSRFSFLNYVKHQGRIHQYYIRESFYPLRSEYSEYCAWVADQLDSVHWNNRVTAVRHAPEQNAETGARWLVEVAEPGRVEPRRVLARNVVSGVGTAPFVPEPLRGALGNPGVLHSSEYLDHAEELTQADSVTVVGSGQSAAEIYRDLLDGAAQRGSRLDWITRSPRFFPMEYTKLTLELTSPEYTRYFHGLDLPTRDRLNRSQRNLYKGISEDLVNDIYDTLYRLNVQGGVNTTLRGGISASWVPAEQSDAPQPTDGTSGRYRLALEHAESGASGVTATDAIVLATGYRAPQFPPFFEPIRENIRLDEKGRYDVGLEFDIDDAGSLFVLNAEEHTHALNAPDLGMGPWRNSIILQRILGREVYQIERSMCFQSFGGANL